MKYLNLIRWKNLLLIALVQLLIKYGLFQPLGVATTLDDWKFLLLIVVTLCIAAAGNVINDIYDLEADAINKPEQVIIGKRITEKRAFNLFVILNVMGIGLGFYLSNFVGRPILSMVFIGISILLYMYASSLKQMLVIKNVLIAFLVAVSLIVVALFDLLPAITLENQPQQLAVFHVVLTYAFFAFCINLIREMVKDLQDIDGDHKTGLNTVPIAIGRERATKVASAMLIFFIFGVIYYVITHLYQAQLVVGYFLLCVIAPLIYSAIKLIQAETKAPFKHVSMMLKIVMLLGMLSLVLYPLSFN